MLKTSMVKSLFVSILILGMGLPVKAQVGPGLGSTDAVSNYQTERYASVCTSQSNGRLSMRMGPGQEHRKIKEVTSGQLVALVNGTYSPDGFYWWNVLHNGSRGWVRSDYLCGDPQ